MDQWKKVVRLSPSNFWEERYLNEIPQILDTSLYWPSAVHMHRPEKLNLLQNLKKTLFQLHLRKKEAESKVVFFITKQTVFLRNFNCHISIFKKRISVFIKFVWAVHMHRPKNTLGGAYAPPTALFKLL